MTGMNTAAIFGDSGEALRILSDLVENSAHGLMIGSIETKSILYCNEQARVNLGMTEEAVKEGFEGLFSEEEEERLFNTGTLTKNIKGRNCRFHLAGISDKYVYFHVLGADEISRIEQSIESLRDMNRQMRDSLMSYDQSSLLITNEKGEIEFIGQETVDNCGYDKSWYIGKTVFELEEQKLFYPSVAKLVLETGEQQVVIQSAARTEKMLVAVGVPMFDENGNIEKVLSVTKNFSDQMNLNTLIARMEMDIDEADQTQPYLAQIISCSDEMYRIKNLIKMIAPMKSTVLILGETGTGKDVLARAIHRLSPRKDKPFIKVSCGAIAPNLVESELFGYEAGSFTGASKDGKTGLIEAADGGTLFLDEIGELPMDQQVKLLRVLQERSIIRVGGTEEHKLDIRVIAATNRNLKERIKKGEFREDLFYRLNIVSIEIPPIRERKEDIPLLISYFTKKFNRAYRTEKIFSKTVIQMLSQYSWPGNVREMENCVESIIVSTSSNYIEPQDLPYHITEDIGEGNPRVIINGIIPLSEAVKELEIQLLQMAMKEFKTTTEIANALGVNQSTVSRKITQYGLNR
ncbi:MAG: sigma 54-interacting transcriptional regulator [Firmicutes bacterium]|nr:sigma 54-interacting transcriptional regulator [Bacillota bacterium]